VAAAVALYGGAQRHGVFRQVQWTDGEMPACSVVYIEHLGAYKDIGKVFDELIAHLKAKGVRISFEHSRLMGASCP
jgi:hypothetical protein